jgi:DNA invertase Pin-like site-specific DNA recombinase
MGLNVVCEQCNTIGIYIRVSTEEQAKEGYSIPAQKERLTSFCASQGWDNYRFYIDEGVSAKDMNRPKLQLLLDDVKTGKINIILVYRLDRFTRKVKDLHKMLEMLESHSCSFKSATEPYDTTTAMGKLFITIVAALAEWETDNLSERIKMALEEKVSSGERVGNIPYPFDLDKNEKLISNKKRTAVTLDMIDKIESGKSANQVAKFLTKTNDDKLEWHPTAVLRILKNPALCGDTHWQGKVFSGTHLGIISRERWNKLQQILEDNSIHRNREVESIYLFQGKLICSQCKSILSVNRYVRKRSDGSEYQGVVYKCQVCWKQGRKMLTIGEYRFLDALYDYMRNVEIHHIELPEEKDEVSVFKEQLQQISKRREKYQRAWAADKMTDDEFDKLMDETREIMDELTNKINQIQAPVPTLNIEEIKQTIFYFNENFHKLTDEERREFISRFIRKIEFKLIAQQPSRPDKYKKGKDLVVITDVLFY